MHLTNEQWAVVQPLIPPPRSAALRGRPPVDERRVLDGILWKLAADIPWYDLPDRYPPHQTCYRRYIQWQRSGLLDRITAALLKDLVERGHLDLEAVVQKGDLLFTRDGQSWRIHLSPTFAVDWRSFLALVFARSITERLIPPPPSQSSHLSNKLQEFLTHLGSLPPLPRDKHLHPISLLPCAPAPQLPYTSLTTG